MTWREFALDASPWIAKVTFFTAIGFIVGYSILAPWWRRSIGWTLVLLDFVIAILLLPAMLQFLAGISVSGSEFWTLTTLGAFAAVPLIITWRFILLARAQWQGRQGEP